MELIKKYFVHILSFVFLIIGVYQQSNAQTITIDNTNFFTGPYGQRSDITVLFKVDGCFNVGNQFQLYISDATGSFTSEQLIGTFNGFFASFINGKIPANLAPASGYKLRVKSTSPAVTSASTIASIQVNSYSLYLRAKTNSLTASRVLEDSVSFGFCSGIINGAVLTMVDSSTIGSTVTTFLKNEVSNVVSGPLTYTANQLSLTLERIYYTYTVKAEKDGIMSTRSYFVINSPNRLGLATDGEQQGCLPDTLRFQIGLDPSSGGIGGNFPGTRYVIQWGDNTLPQTFLHCQLIASGGQITHLYTYTSCDSAQVSFNVTTTLVNNWYNLMGSPTQQNCDRPQVTTRAKIFKKPKVLFVLPDTACINTPVLIRNLSDAGQSQLGGSCVIAADYVWYVDGIPISVHNFVSPPPDLTYTFTTIGPHEVKLVVENGSCGSGVLIDTICIEPVPIPDFKINGLDSISGCVPLVFSPTNLTIANPCKPTRFQWRVVDSLTNNIVFPGVVYSVAPSLTAGHPTFTFLQPGRYKIKLFASNSCGTFESNFRYVHVIQTAAVTTFGNKQYCGLRTINFATDPNHIPTYNTTIGSETATWVITGGSFTYLNGTNANSLYPHIQFNDFTTYNLQVTFSNACGTATAGQNITFNQPVTASSTSGLKDTSFCYSVTNIVLNASFTGQADSIRWLTSGSGNFSDAAVVNPIYTFSIPDKNSGLVELIFRVYPKAPTVCPIVSDTLRVAIQLQNTGNNTTKNVCSNQSVNFIPVSTVSGSTFTWTSTIVSGSVTGNSATGSGNINDILINGSPTNDALIRYIITPAANGCTSVPFELMVTLNPRPDLISFILPDTICNRTAINIALSSNVAGVQYTWSSVFTGSVTGNSNQVSPIAASGIFDIIYSNSTTNVVGTYIIQVEGGTGCAGEKDTLYVVVRPSPTTANVGADLKLCNQSSVNVTGNNPVVGDGSWFILSGNGITISNPNNVNTIVNGLLPDSTYQLVWQIAAYPGCSPSKDTLVIVNRPLITTANAGTDIIVCDFQTSSSVTLNANINSARPYEIGVWNILNQPAGGNAIFGNGNNPTTSLTFSKSGVYQLEWSISNDAGCVPSKDTVLIKVYDKPVAGFITSSSPDVCINDNVTFTLNSYTGLIKKWQYNTNPISDNIWIDTLITNPSITFTNLQDTIAVRVFVESAGKADGCNTVATSNALINNVAPATIAGVTNPDATVCKNLNSGSISLSGFLGSVTQWEFSINNGSTWNTIPSTTTSINYNNLSTTTWYRAIVKSGACSGYPSDITVITVVESVTIADAGLDKQLCNQSSSTLSGNGFSLIESAFWSQVSGPNTATFSSTTNPSTTISGLIPGTYRFIWQISNSICPVSKDTIEVINYTDLTNVIDTTTKALCNAQAINLTGTAPTGATGVYLYQWQQSTDAVSWTNIVGAINSNYSFTANTTFYYRRIVTSGPCIISSFPVLVNVQPALANNNLPGNQSICINTSAAIIIGSIPVGGDGNYSYEWESSTNNGVTWITIVGASNKDYSPGILVSNISYRRKVSSMLCSGPQSIYSAMVTITVNPDAKAQFTSTTTLGCYPFILNSSTIQTVSFPLQNSIYEWYTNGVLIGTGSNFPGYTILNPQDSILIKLKTISLFGCRNDSMEQKFFTYAKPNPAMTVSDSVGCGPLSVLFTNNTIHKPEFNYIWNFGNGQTSNLRNPGTIQFAISPLFTDTTYTVSLKVFTACDTVITTQKIRVKSKPKTLFSPNRTVGCSPMLVSFNNNSLGTNTTYIWDFDDGSTLSTTTTGVVQHTFNTGVQDTFYVKLKSINECGSDSQQYAIVVSPNAIRIDFAVNGNEQFGCSPHTVRFINNSIGATSFTWNFGDGNTLITTNNFDTVIHTYVQTGTFNIVLRATNGCSDTTDVETISVFAKPNVNYTASSYNICIGDSVIFTNLSDVNIGYLWKFGDGSTTSNTNPVKMYSTPGLYNVTLIGIKQYAPGNSCIDSISKQINVIANRPAIITVSDTVSNCSPFTVTFTNLSTPSVVTNWNFGDGTNATGDVVTHTYTTIGAFNVSMNALSPGGCIYQTTKNISVFGPTGSWFYDNGYICNDRPVRYEVVANNTDSLRWDFGDGTFLSTNNKVVFHTYTQPGNYLPKVELIGGTTCRIKLNGVDTIKLDRIKAGFKVTDQKFCGNTNVSFTDTSRAFFGIQQWSWAFGDGNTSNLPNPQNSYTATNTWPIQLVLTGKSGCTDTARNLLFVKINNKPILGIVSDSTACVNQPISFAPITNSIDTVSFYKWNFGNGATSNNPFATNIFTLPSTYSVQLVAATNFGCYDTVYKNIIVYPTPNVIASNNVLICKGQSTALFVSGANSYSWSPINGLSCTTCINPIATPTSNTNYVVSGNNSFGCIGRDTVFVTVAQPFSIQVSANDTLCIGQQTQLAVMGANNYKWFPASGLNNDTSKTPIASPVLTTRYQVVGYDNVSCFSDTAYVTVAVGNYPIINLGQDKILPAGTQLILNASVVNGPLLYYRWSPATDLSCANCPTPIATIKKSVCYSLLGINIYGCDAVDTICIKAFCESAQVFIPNAFTPDNDGVNDVLMVRGTGIKLVKSFRVFNRWGQVVFERANFTANDPNFGWDGRIKGALSVPDVYVYTCEVVCEDDTPFIFKGNVSIIK